MKKTIASIIHEYKARNVPYGKRDDYRSEIAKLSKSIKALQLNTKTPGSPDEKYYCYVYLNPLKAGKFKYVCPSGKVVCFKYEPFYVGKGIRSRYRHHIKAAENESDLSRKSKTIRKIQRILGDDPIIVVIPTRVDDWTAQAFEIDLIAGIGRIGINGPLLNLTDGGDGSSGYVPTEEDRRKNSEGQKGKIISAEHRRKLSIAGTGRVPTELARANMRAAQKGKVISQEQRDKQSKIMTGRKRSKESCEKQSKTITGVPKSKSHRENIGNAHRGKTHDGVEIIVNGIYYRTLKDASKDLNMHPVTIRQRLLSDNHPDYLYYGIKWLLK